MIEQPLTPSADAEIRALIQAHRKIYAIKLLREKTGLGLKEAKDTVDAMEREMGSPPGSTMPESRGGLVLAVVLFTGLLAWWWLRG